MSFRLDRFLAFHLLGPITKRRPVRGVRIPILMYHSISEDKETGHPYFWINTSPALFAQQMRYLADRDYEVISLSRAVDMIKQGARSEDRGSRDTSPLTVHRSPFTVHRYAVLTFDDGYADFYTHAFPVLKRHGFTATVFLPTDYIGNGAPGLRGKTHLTWDQVRELAAAGITFGSHTCSHPQLHGLSPEDMQRELSVSKRTIESHLNLSSSSASAGDGNGFLPATGNRQPATVSESEPQLDTRHSTLKTSVTAFCYPYKFPEQDRRFLAELADTLSSSGYHSCVSTWIGTVNAVEDIFGLKRIPVNSGDDLELFAAKLSGAYDWIAALQGAWKRIWSGAAGRR